MTISLQGSWTISVASKSAEWDQRFRVVGSTNGADGTYTGSTSTTPVFVAGAQWGVTVEHNPTGPESWSPNLERLGNFRVSGGQFLFDIQSDDGGNLADADFNDLVLTCAMPLSATDWVIYGRVQTYSGFCRFNPCYPWPFLVIDTIDQLRAVLQIQPARAILERLYPDVVSQVIRRPIPIPDPPPFRPLMIPTGMPDDPGFLVEGRTELAPAQKGKRASAEVTATKSASLHLFSSRSDASSLRADELVTIGKLRDRLQLFCEVDPVSETLLRFQEYDRTGSELAGGAYTGAGARETLGLSSTDPFGWYVFRFSRSIGDLIGEALADVALGEDATVAALPDVIVQIMESLPEGVAFETAPYYDIPNVKRIDLCIPKDKLVGTEQPCQSGRAIQTLGNIAVVPNPDSQLHGDGTVSNSATAVSGPFVQHAAWTGGIYVYGCFEDASPTVTTYTWEYRQDGDPDWHFVNEPYSYLKKQLDGTWASSPVGPTDTALHVDGAMNPAVTVPAYANIETDPAWMITQRHRKIILSTGIYQSGFGAVSFRMTGYDAGGDPVPGAVDIVRLLIDQIAATGDVDFVALSGGGDPGECALLELSDPGAPLIIRYRVRNLEGFLLNYGLSVYRGSNHLVQISGAPISGAYTDVSPFRYQGTPDEVGADLDGYVDVSITPTSGTWLDGNQFCAFDFELGSQDRLTDGQGVVGSRTLWRELVGLSYTPPMP